MHIRWKRLTKFAALLAVVLAAGWAAWVFQARRNIAALRLAPTSSYVASGGTGYLVLAPDRWGGMTVVEGFLPVGHEMYGIFGANSRIKASLSGQMLSIEIRSRSKPGEIVPTLSGLPSHYDVVVRMKLAASTTRPGDWDLEALSLSDKIVHDASVFSPEAWKLIRGQDSIRDAAGVVRLVVSDEKVLTGTLDPRFSPVRSFLHRIDDERLADYYRKRLAGAPDAEALPLIRELDAAHPGDPWLLPQRVELEARSGDLAEAEAAQTRWKALGPGSGDRLLNPEARAATASLETARLKKAQPGFASFAEAFPNTPHAAPNAVSLQHRLEWLRAAGKYDGLLHWNPLAIFPALSAGFNGGSIPNFVDLQTTAKIARTEAILDLFAGRRDEALEILAGAYRTGQSMNAEGFLIERLIGIALRAIAINGLEIYAFNACQTPEELKQFNDTLAFLDRTPGQETGATLLDGELSPLMQQMILDSTYAPNKIESATRQHVADAKWAVLRTGTAAWGKHLTDGKWPAAAGDLARWLPSGRPADPFAAPDPIHFRADGDDLLVWSVGPDKFDDLGARAYDPSNGTASSGDILTRIPAKRAYPFPEGGARAGNAAQLLAQFPNGLPVDSFSNVANRPLSILDGTPSQPLVIFSWGPDTDENNARMPSAKYETEGKSGIDLQLIFQRPATGGWTPPPSSIIWELEPMYDPTNGMASAGDLYLEIPKP